VTQGSAPEGAPARLRIDLPTDEGARGYDILIGPALLAQAGAHIAPLLSRPRTVVVTDETVDSLHGGALRAALETAGIAQRTIVLPPGEGTKSFAQLEALTRDLLRGDGHTAGLERGDTLIALGGGVIGDLVGFAAAVTLRGIAFIQIPTTLLAQVDSSVGGKTGINLPEGKNLVGAFHQPRLVLADTGVLETLPRRELLAGYAEIYKYGLLGDAAFAAWLEQHGASVLAGPGPERAKAIETACRMKAAIVAEDEREAGKRALLNLGHTFAHALEAECGYTGALLHGEAVGIGMGLAFDLSAKLGLCPEDLGERVRAHLRALGAKAGLEDVPGGPLRAEALLGHMYKDKKVTAGALTFVLARGVGEAFTQRGVEDAAVLSLLKEKGAS